jgi:hypothetical protein
MNEQQKNVSAALEAAQAQARKAQIEEQIEFNQTGR